MSKKERKRRRKLSRKAKPGTRYSYEVLFDESFFVKLLKFPVHMVVDIYQAVKSGRFNEYGLTVFVGRQGSGKTISMVAELERIRRDFPDVLILTNFGYKHQNRRLTSWEQLVDVRNDAGVVFAIDEIQNEFDVYDSRNFNLELLKVITQQRKQGIKILASSQVFTRVSKPLREQAFEVVECNTLIGRWTFNKCFDADDYNLVIDQPDVDKVAKVRRKWRRNFIQTDVIRNLYNSYDVIHSMTKIAKDGHRQGL